MDKEGKISFCLSFVSGFVDTAGFIALFGLFTAHVTGNLVLAGASFFDHDNVGNLAAKLCMLPIFIVAVMFTNFLIMNRQYTLTDLILIESLMIACFSVIGGMLFYKTALVSNQFISLTASFAVTGMAIQNTYTRKILTHFSANTMMTGNLTQFSISLFDVVTFWFKKDKQIKPEDTVSFNNLKKTGIVLLGFLTGCFCGAFLVIKVGLICCLFPSIILLWIRLKINLS